MNRKKGLHDEIASVAYELYEIRDRAHGHDFDDWVQAEKIIMEKHERHAKEIGKDVDVDNVKKGKEGFSKTVKKQSMDMEGN